MVTFGSFREYFDFSTFTLNYFIQIFVLLGEFYFFALAIKNALHIFQFVFTFHSLNPLCFALFFLMLFFDVTIFVLLFLRNLFNCFKLGFVIVVMT